MAEQVRITVNGVAHQLDVTEAETLLSVLRYRLRLTGTKECCKEGQCGACTVLMNGMAVRSCQVPAAKIDQAEILTIEGLADGETLDPIQQAFIDENVVQCGFCTPGMIMAAKALLQRNVFLTEDEIRAGMAKNICRCGAYPNILRAIMKVNRQAMSGLK
ncbi:MAG: (2Fe-2S)-binding protein [Bacillota bacterium]